MWNLFIFKSWQQIQNFSDHFLGKKNHICRPDLSQGMTNSSLWELKKNNNTPANVCKSDPFLFQSSRSNSTLLSLSRWVCLLPPSLPPHFCGGVCMCKHREHGLRWGFPFNICPSPISDPNQRRGYSQLSSIHGRAHHVPEVTTSCKRNTFNSNGWILSFRPRESRLGGSKGKRGSLLTAGS